MNSYNEFILKSDGAIIRRDVTESELRVERTMMQPLMDSMSLFIPNAFPMPEFTDRASIYVKGAGTVFTVNIRIRTLVLNAPFTTDDNILYPKFSSTSSPIMRMEWKVLDSMNLRFVARVAPRNGGNAGWALGKCWLFAFSENGSLWRLPISNVYEDCSICMGEMASADADSMGGIFLKALIQFKNSSWNKDLDFDTTSERTCSMFRWNAKKEPFEQMKIEAPNWTNLCTKVSSQIVNEVNI